MNFNYSKAESYLKSLQGYRLDNIHFRIGSKYHTDTFIHARVLLQNSFYTSRIALVLADKIYSYCIDKSLLEITLVGYERYSELLLGLLTNFLHTLNPGIRVSSCIMVDVAGKMRPVTTASQHFKNCFSIVPIVSTGTTSKRLSQAYSRLVGNAVVWQTYHVFQLSRKDHKIEESESLYRIDVNWYEPHKCELCYGKNSIPLLEADKTNLNPVAIFEFPEKKDVYRIADPVIVSERENTMPGEIVKGHSFFGCIFQDAIFDHSLQYQKDNKFKDFRVFSHLTESFISENLSGIEKWLDSLVDELSIKQTDRIYILSSCHVMTNSSFVSLVNNRVFGSSATVIYLEPEKEYAENFKRNHREVLSKTSDDSIKVFYVDDDLFSGRTFFSIYDLFRYSSGYGGVGLSAAIFLMNKANPSVSTRVNRAAKNVYAYVSINMPRQHSVSDLSPFDREIQRYDRIIERCLYYEPEAAFSEKCKSLRNFDASDAHHERHLIMFYATHVLYALFSDEKGRKKIAGGTFNELIKTCEETDPRITDRFAVLKVLSCGFFTMYKPIRDLVFKWVTEETSSITEEIKECCESNTLNDETLLENLIFMIHRSVVLGNMQVVSGRFFERLSKLFRVIDSDGFPQSSAMAISDRTPESFVKELIIRYVELVSYYPATAVKIKGNICSGEDWFKEGLGKQFKSRLLDEISFVLQDLYEYVTALGFEERFIIEGKDLISFDRYCSIVNKWFEDNGIFQTTRFKVADIVMGNGEGILSQRIIQYLFIKSYIKCDLNGALPSKGVEKKTIPLCRQLKEIVSPETRIGGFFVVRDVLGNNRLVFDEDDQHYSVLGNRFNEAGVKCFFEKLEDGVNSDKRIVIERHRDKDATNDEKSNDSIWDILHCSVLHIYRIGHVNSSSISGIMGFYTSDEHVMDQYSRRYFLLLRRDLLRFIDYHHKNEEFIQSLMAEEKRKFAYLTGHGRDVMVRLSRFDDSFIPILDTMECIQGIFVNPQTIIGSVRESLDRIFRDDIIDISVARDFVQEELRPMALSIYMNDVVEYSETPKEDGFEATGNGTICFSKVLLKYICFELIINAKKNKFQKSANAYRDVYSDEELKFDGNHLGIKVELENNKMTVSVFGTGPEIESELLNRIVNNWQIKEKGDISGLDLIINLIKIYNSENKVSMTSEPSSYRGVMINTVSVTVFSNSTKK